YSALFMAEFGSGIKIDTIEKVPARIEDARDNFEKYDVKKCIHLIEGDAAGVLEGLVQHNKSYDLIFLDAAKAQYMKYLFFLEKLMNKEAVLITDNVRQEGELLESRYAVNRRDRTIHSRMREFLKEITDNTKWNTIVLPVGDGVAVSTKNHIPERLD
ncbi:MAG: O-methyltransferase, partial [Lachnospiraceae bacterium]|nr:O-methyltransferase [Lachnospiraceae bacterium]